MYFSKEPSKMVKKPIWLFSKGTQSEKCTVPTESNAFCALVMQQGGPTSFKAKACRRDLKAMYVSKGACEVLPVKPAARANALMS